MKLNLFWPEAAAVHPPGRTARRALGFLCGAFLLLSFWVWWLARTDAAHASAQLAELKGRAADLSARQRRLLPDERAWALAQAAQAAAWSLDAQRQRMQALWALLEKPLEAFEVQLGGVEFKGEEALLSGRAGSERAITAWMQVLGASAAVQRVQLHELNAQSLDLGGGARRSYRFRMALQLVPDGVAPAADGGLKNKADRPPAAPHADAPSAPAPPEDLGPEGANTPNRKEGS